MDRRVQVAVMATVLLSGGAPYLYLNGIAPDPQHRVQVAQGGIVLEQCLYAAQLEFDVHWAAACTTQVDADDSADCDLPDAKAAVVNAWMNDAEKQCRAEARGLR
jgi:hypothetical protein